MQRGRRCIPALIGAIAAALVVLIGSQASPARQTLATRGVSAQALIAQLAVLRRPQTASDLMPPYAVLPHSPRTGAVIPSLTRLVASFPGLELFMLVTTPAPGSPPLWSPRLGDQVAILAVTPNGSMASAAVPAADLTNAYELAGLGP